MGGQGTGSVGSGGGRPGWPGVVLLTPLPLQIDRYAQLDLKKGLRLYGTSGNVGLTNAWSIIQTDVRGQVGAGRGPTVGLDLRGQEAWRAPPQHGPRPVPPAVPLLRCLQLHRLVRGLQCHACARLLLPGVQ